MKYFTCFILITIYSQLSFAAPETNNNIPVMAKDNTEVPQHAIFRKTVKQDMEVVYKRVFTALENNGYFVIFEPNIGKNLSHFAKRWGDDYNKNKLEHIRSMIFCNGWYANKISNVNPYMLALCPLHITLYSKDNETNILFVKPSGVASGTNVADIARELENDVIRAINTAIH